MLRKRWDWIVLGLLLCLLVSETIYRCDSSDVERYIAEEAFIGAKK